METRADACAAPCSPTLIAPVQGGSLPASAPSIPVRLGAMETQANVGFELRGAGGELVVGSAVLIGGAPIEPAKIRIKVTCGEDNGEVVAPPATQKPVTVPSPEKGAPPANPGAPTTSPGDSPSAEDGCAMSPGRGGAIPGLLVAIGALLAARVRRRR